MPSKFSYRRLKNEEDEGRGFNENDYQEALDKAIEHVRSSTKWPSSCTKKLKRVHIKKRFKIKIPSLKRFLKKKARVLVCSLAKIVKRFKESQEHFGDMFAGNYLFMQITPTSFKYGGADKKGRIRHFPARNSISVMH